MTKQKTESVKKKSAAKEIAPKKAAAKTAVTKKAVAKNVAIKADVAKKPRTKPTSSMHSNAKVAVKTVSGLVEKAKTRTQPAAHTSLPDALPILPFASEEAWASWLQSNAAAPGLWLKIAKKNAGIATVSYAQALDVALCHGWIDGQKRSFDEHYFLQRFTPRRPRSLWSKINIGHVERLIAAGRMRAGGLREADAAKADGRWDAAYHGASRMEVPELLTLALAKNKAAAAFFETLDKTNRYSVCWRVQTAKTEATRKARVETLVEMLARGEKIHP